MQITGLEVSSTMPQREEALGFFPLGRLRCCLPSRGPLHPPPPRGRLTASFNLCSRCLQDAARTRLREARLPGSLIPGCVTLKLTCAVQGGQGPRRDTHRPPRYSHGLAGTSSPRQRLSSRPPAASDQRNVDVGASHTETMMRCLLKRGQGQPRCRGNTRPVRELM